MTHDINQFYACFPQIPFTNAIVHLKIIEYSQKSHKNFSNNIVIKSQCVWGKKWRD